MHRMRERESEREKTMRDIGHGQQEKFPCECLFWFFSIALELHTHIYEDYDRMIYATWYPCKRSFEIKQRPAFLGFFRVFPFFICAFHLLLHLHSRWSINLYSFPRRMRIGGENLFFMLVLISYELSAGRLVRSCRCLASPRLASSRHI